MKTSRINLNCFDDTTCASVFANGGGGWDRIETCSALVAVHQRQLGAGCDAEIALRAGHRRLTEHGPESGGRIAAWVARTRFQILHLLQRLDFTSLEILMSLKFALAL
jgi:hypothetical protein